MAEPPPNRTLRGADVLDDPLVRELLDARLVAVLATVDADGSPYAVPVWYAGDGTGVVVGTSSASRKVRNLERDPRATLVLHDSRPGLDVCGATLIGSAEVVRPPDAAALVELVHRRYVTEEALRGAVGALLRSDDVAIRLRPERATTWDLRGVDVARIGGLPLAPTTPRS